MKPFRYTRVRTVKEAVAAVAGDPDARFIAGGTNLIDLMKRGVVQPERLVDISRLPLDRIEHRNGVLRIGALALNSSVAENRLVQEKQPLLVQALLAGASGQLRNMATVGGNLLQRTRCPYFYDTALPCNKRGAEATDRPGCGALEGYNRQHAIFGVGEDSPTCIAVHPSDLCVALAALDATVLVTGRAGDRRIPFGDFHRLPGDRPERDTTLNPGELIVAVHLPDAPFTRHVHYLKVRDRASYAFALVSAAVVLDLADGRIREARLAFGGVAHRPWRLPEAEKMLVGKTPSEAVFRQAAGLAMQGAKAFGHNAYKLQLAPDCLVQALLSATGAA